MSDFIEPRDHRALILDLTLSSSIGAQPGTENLAETLKTYTSLFDGVILNPGQLDHHAELVGGKRRAAPLVRVDWTNAYRDKEFCLPALRVERVTVSDGEDALALGASAVVATLLLGYGEDLESESIRSISHLARECYGLSIPIIVDVRPTGDKISAENYTGSIKLGTSFMMEAGADALILPPGDAETRTLIGKWSTIPVMLRFDEIPEEEALDEYFQIGICGLVLSERIMSTVDVEEKCLRLKQKIHS